MSIMSKEHTTKQYCNIARNCIWKTSFSSAIMCNYRTSSLWCALL